MAIADKFNVFKSKYFYMLCILTTYYIGASLFDNMQTTLMPTSFLFTITIVTCIYILLRENLLIYFLLIFGAMMIVSHYIVAFSSLGISAHRMYYTVDIIFLILAGYAIVYSISHHHDVTADTLFGAVCGYFVLGLLWSFVYLLIETFDPTAFSVRLTGNSLHQSALNASYFSYSTLTSLGYGDVLPVSYIAKTCAWLETISGQIYLAVWISQLVGLRIAQRGLHAASKN